MGHTDLSDIYIHIYVCIFKVGGIFEEERSGLISIPKKGNAKECLNYCTIALISHASKVML